MTYSYFNKYLFVLEMKKQDELLVKGDPDPLIMNNGDLSRSPSPSPICHRTTLSTEPRCAFIPWSMAHRPGGGALPRECPRLTRERLTIDEKNRMKDKMDGRWMKTSCNRGEWREEIKLVAKVSGLSIDGAKIVVRRRRTHLYRRDNFSC